jgi:hypothetical protein
MAAKAKETLCSLHIYDVSAWNYSVFYAMSSFITDMSRHSYGHQTVLFRKMLE